MTKPASTKPESIKPVVHPSNVAIESSVPTSEVTRIVNDIHAANNARIKELTDELTLAKEDNTKFKNAISNIAPYVRNDIPTSFEMTGIVYKVTMKDNSKEDYASFDPTKCEIDMYTKSNGDDINPQLVNKAFYHELVHCIANAFKLNDLYDNEVAIDNIACGLMMFLQTRRYDIPNINKEGASNDANEANSK